MKHKTLTKTLPYYTPNELYTGIEKPLLTMRDVENEIERLAKVINESIEAAGLGIARLKNIVDKGIDLNGDLKRKINWLNIEYEGIYPKNLQRSLRPFVTDAFFKWLTPNNFLMEQGPPLPSGNPLANIIWAGEQYGQFVRVGPSCSIIWPIGFQKTVYLCIDTKESIPYNSGYTVFATESTTTACKDGTIVLFSWNNTNRSFAGWVQGHWGGGALVF